MTDESLSDKRKELFKKVHQTPTSFLQVFNEIEEQDKEKIQNAQRRLKDEIVENDIYTADEIFRIINKIFTEEFGGKLLK